MLALCDEPLLTDEFPPTSLHNIGARVLRHGLAVTAFSSLEKYVGSRFAELFTRINRSALSYSDFNDDLKVFLSRDAAAGLLNRVSFMEEGLKQAYFDANIGQVAAYLADPSQFTSFGFSPRGSNVSHEDIKKAFRALGMKDAWGQLRTITVAVGSARISLVDDFRNLSRTRNKSAHDPESNVPSSDLKTHIEISILIGIAVDVLTSGVATAYTSAATSADLDLRLAELPQAFRFVDQETDGLLVERSTLSGRAFKRYANEGEAIAGALARSGSPFVIVRSPGTTPLALA